ncbi:MAG: hypothetical protein ACYSU7_11970, partial [Planctomycetota bacterium]
AGESEAARLVKAPTLLIHAEHDLGMKALDRDLAATHEVLVIPESGQVYKDPISVELMVSATVYWLVDHLVVPVPTAPPTSAPTAATPAAEPAPDEVPPVETNPPDTSQAPAS